MEYIVEVTDYLRNITLFYEEYKDANTAYHEYRRLDEQFHGDEGITVRLLEPY